ncbi:hypothetical protein A8709_30285 [Paenibacillus pectinilyticus]|uniref:HTH luxR-type domain-containing protein n=1 Tax=Paenibacillus pectinilyticus TaxID=512399 RepID=A0A1C0ZVL3_9BACL|nr:helix-turn-helix transcriptional regulator [Paenibacillus pectinilyticus]OCT12143.1 hypothetical protein A8709_30285 [Paenibacillus pectinilyticus]
MLDSEDYKKINIFKDFVNRYHFKDSEFTGFRKRVSIALGEILHYHHVIFGYIDFKERKELSLNIAVHNIKLDLIQKLFNSTFLQDQILNSKNDILILSETENYKKRIIYKQLLNEYNYSDFMLFFLRVDHVYNGYIILFKDKSQKTFTKTDKDIIANTKDYISIEYYNYLSYLKLKSLNDLLINQTNYFPIGIIIMKDRLSFSYANETARIYMEEIGISSQKFFGVFYNSYILSEVNFDMNSLGKKHTIRYKNFIFSIVPLNPFTDSNSIDLEKFKHSLDHTKLFNKAPDITSYIYVLKDELTSLRLDKDSYDEYSFSKREREIIDLLLLGNDNKQISQQLGISINTVRVHMQKIYRKTDATNMAELLFKIKKD